MIRKQENRYIRLGVDLICGRKICAKVVTVLKTIIAKIIDLIQFCVRLIFAIRPI